MFTKKILCFVSLTALACFVVAVTPLYVAAQYDVEKTEPERKDVTEEETKDIVDTAIAADFCRTLCKALRAADLVETLREAGPFTLFVPSNDAFDKLPEGKLDALLGDKEKLRAVLKCHIVRGRLMAADVMKLDEVETLGGQKLRITTEDGWHINDAKVIKTDIIARNGVIHVIDTVLMPE